MAWFVKAGSAGIVIFTLFLRLCNEHKLLYSFDKEGFEV